MRVRSSTVTCTRSQLASTAVVDAAAMHPPPAAVRDPAERSDVDVQHLAGSVPFLADVGGSAADDLAGESIDLAQARQLPAAQYRADGRGRELQQPGQRGWAGVLVQACPDDPQLHRQRRAPRAPEVARLGRTLREWRSQVLAHCDTDGLSNGGTEAIKMLIERARRLAHGATATSTTTAS